MVTFKEWEQDLNSLPVEEQKFFIIESLQSKKNLHIFGKYLFPHIIKGESEVPECHNDLIGELTKRVDSGIIFPRGHAKSTWEKIDTIHDIVYALEPVILYIANTLNDAGFHFESIKTELENNDLLIKIYGNLVPDLKQVGVKWTNKHFETTNGVNVVARGAGKGRGVNIKNKRPTKIVADDIEDDEQVKSPDRRKKLHNWLYNVIFPSLDKDRGFIKMIGTVLHPYAEVLQFYKKHGGIFRKAIENGKPIWWTIEQLEDIRGKIGTTAFNQEYMNSPSAEEEQVIKSSWLDKSIYVNELNINEMRVNIMIDPQSGEKETSDEMGICVLAYTKGSSHRFVVDSLGIRDTLTKKAGKIIELWLKYKARIDKVGIEVVLNQNALYQLLIEWRNGADVIPEYGDIQDRNIPIISTSPKGKDKLERLRIHEPSFERGEVHLRPEHAELYAQLTNFPNVEHDDRMDALLYCLEYSNYISGEKMVDETQAFTGTIIPNIMEKKY